MTIIKCSINFNKLRNISLNKKKFLFFNSRECVENSLCILLLGTQGKFT